MLRAISKIKLRKTHDSEQRGHAGPSYATNDIIGKQHRCACQHSKLAAVTSYRLVINDPARSNQVYKTVLYYSL